MSEGGTNQNNLKERVPLSAFRNKYRLNQNPLCQPGADGEARVADQTNDVGLACEQLDDLVFAEADFPQTSAHLWRRAQFLDPHRQTGAHAVQWTESALVARLAVLHDQLVRMRRREIRGCGGNGDYRGIRRSRSIALGQFQSRTFLFVEAGDFLLEPESH